MPTALVSIHDVMPETLPRVASILGVLRDSGVDHCTLLVVPGRPWPPSALAQLRAWQRTGHALAGHGWTHRISSLRSFRHRLHSRLISRQAAEHLSLDGPAITALMNRNHRWFAESGLSAPELYVPPAWALGPLDRKQLARQPFRFVETLAGVHDTHTGRSHRIPVIGFEADTPTRATALRLINALMRGVAGRRLLRVAIHPYDMELRLRASLWRTVAAIRRTAAYADLARGGTDGRPPG